MPFLRRLAASLAIAAAVACALAAPTVAAPRWLVVGDIHLDPSARRAALAPAGYDTGDALFASTLAAMKRVEPDPPVIVITGDLLAHHFDGDALSTMRAIAAAFDRTFPRAQFVLAIGNNDDPCGDYRIGTGSAYLRALAAIWAPLVDRRGAAPQFAREFAYGGYYTAMLPGSKLRAVVVNSVLWSWLYRDCTPGAGAPAGALELAWFAARLARAPAGTRDLIVMHIPPGYDARTTGLIGGVAAVPFLTRRANAAFVATVAAYRGRIAGLIAGHEHDDDVRDVAGVPLLVASSVSPIYGNAPTFYALDPLRDGRLRDIRPYRLVDGTWVARPARVAASVSPFVRCARTELGDGYARCAGIPGRAGDAALALAAIATILTGLPWLGLLRRPR